MRIRDLLFGSKSRTKKGQGDVNTIIKGAAYVGIGGSVIVGGASSGLFGPDHLQSGTALAGSVVVGGASLAALIGTIEW